jgi:protease-4
MTEEYIEGGGRNKVVEIDVTGIISFQGESGLLFDEEDMATRVIHEIEQAGDDPRVVAILLMVDSPGGGVTASDIIYEKLVRFKSTGEGSRKVVALMRDLAASGGYYVSAAADKIVAHRTTITGSIGVLISMANFKGLGDKIGVKDVTIKSGRNKDMLNPLREVGTEETNILQAAVNDMYDRFVSVVARGRGMDAAKVREIADGRIYTATQALALNLVDEIGYREDAITQLKKVTGLTKLKIVKYKTTASFLDLLSSRVRQPAVVELPARWKAQWPQFQYLWQPEL